MRIAFLIQKWGIKFDKYSDILPIFSQVYDALRNKGVQFPPIQNQQQSGQGGSGGQSQPQANKQENTGSKGSGKVPAKYNKLVNDMNLVKGNINFTNEMIDSMKPGEKSETLNDLFQTLTQLEPKLF